jgi:hypothetical protein
MTENLTTLTSKLQAMFIDDGTRFNAATCTAAFRMALGEVNRSAPNHAATLEMVASGQYEYVLSGADYAGLISIVDVLRDDAAGQYVSLDFRPYFEDGSPVIRLDEPERSGDLIVRYTLPWQLNGLDGGTEFLLPDWFVPAFVAGGAFYALMIRAMSRVESINLAPDVSDNYRDALATYYTAFQQGLALLAVRGFPRGKADLRAWDDEEHGKYV